MSGHICPSWLGYLLLNPLRRMIENPRKILGPFIRKGMTILEPGPGMGYFTLPMAEMVGEEGRVIAVDIQPQMLTALEKRAIRAGLGDRIHTRLAQPEKMGIEDFQERIDFVPAIHMIHELINPGSFLSEVYDSLKTGGKLLVIEPRGHVRSDAFQTTIELAVSSGFKKIAIPHNIRGRTALFCRET